MRRDVAQELGYLPGKTCPDCRAERDIASWPLQFFDWRPNGACAKSKDANSRGCAHVGCYSARCTGHMLTARTERDVFEKKVEHSYRRHAKEDGITLPQLLARWGTTIKSQAARWRTEYEAGTCPKDRFGCGRSWMSLPNGPRDLTFDRIDPSGPFLPHNVAALCLTCNVAKHKMHPEQFAVRHRCWQIFDEAPKKLRPVQLSFDLDSLI